MSARSLFRQLKCVVTDSPTILSLALLLIITVLIRPFGDFPLNDDWQYAHIAKNLAETGSLHMDVWVAPSLVIQSWMGALWITLFGFSHLKLRILTFFISCGLVVVLQALFRNVRLDRPSRIAFGLLWVSNPLVVNGSLSFMTEIYGFFWVVLGVYFWFSESLFQRRFSLIFSAIAFGLGFWTRQLGLVVFLALVLVRAGSNLRTAFKELILPVLVVAVFVSGYFFWAHETGNLRAQFTTPLARVGVLNLEQWAVQPGVGLLYLTLFLAPLLVATSWMLDRAYWPSLKRSLLYGTLLLIAIGMVEYMGEVNCSPATHLCADFPSLGNVISPQALGPLTLSDTYTESRILLPRTADALVAISFGAALALLSFLWLPLLKQVLKISDRSPALEVSLVGLVIILLEWSVHASVFNGLVYDRYHLMTFLGGLLLVAGVWVQTGELLEKRKLDWKILFAALLLCVQVIYSIAAGHDYFRWSDARWTAVENLVQKGVSFDQIDGGYEVNGWLANARQTSDGCGKNWAWWCPGRPYLISMTPVEGMKILTSVPISTWWRKMPDLLVLQKSDLNSKRDRP